MAKQPCVLSTQLPGFRHLPNRLSTEIRAPSSGSPEPLIKPLREEDRHAAAPLNLGHCWGGGSSLFAPWSRVQPCFRPTA